MKDTIHESLVFLGNSISSFHHTGSLFPTSRWAASAMTHPIKRAAFGSRPLKVLELGPGTGSVTVQILKEMGPHDELTICEISDSFMNTLKKSLQTNEDFRSHQSRISFFNGPAQDLISDKPYDVIICALPFLNFDLETNESIFKKLISLSHSETIMTFYQYIGLKKLGKILPKRRIRIEKLEPLFDEIEKKNIKDIKVWRNFTPIKIYTIKPQSLSLAERTTSHGRSHHLRAA